MKRHLVIATITVAASLAILAASYGMINNAGMAGDAPVVVIALEIESAVIPQSIADANNEFAFDFYGQVSNNTDNIFFSPISMYTAFSAAYEGARGETALQMKDVFGFEPDDTLRHNATAHMIASINRDDPYATLDIANALWVKDQFPIHESYADIIRNTYLADIENVQFVGPDAEGVDRINVWAAEKTHGKIDKVITEDTVIDATAMVITNAVYFNGTWKEQFSPDSTKQSDFWPSSEGSVKTDFMSMRHGFKYAHMDGVKILKMPYKGDRLSMLVILPDGTDGIAELDGRLSVELLEEWKQNMHFGKVEVMMPKFEMNTKYDLIEPLKNLGVHDVFSGNADLKNISDIFLYVSKAKQDAFVSVNEVGTEAAAVTTLVFDTVSGPTYFIANHPFIFMIQDDESGMILFMGRMSTP